MLFLIFISVTSCADILRVKRAHKGIDPEFKPYIEEFIYISKGKVKKEDFKNLTIGFHNYKPNDSTAGTCWEYGILTEIDISEKWWKENPSIFQRQELVFHELGHCILHRAHTSPPEYSSGFVSWFEKILFKLKILTKKGYLSDGCPSSIMHPYTLSESCINKNYYYYIDELFYNYTAHAKNKTNIHKKCNAPKLINKTKIWNKRDQGTYDRAKETCIKSYNSCLKIFTKITDLSYSALCES